MKFRQKNFLITLFIFLIFLNTCCFLLAYYTQTRNIESNKSICFAEVSIIKKAFENDSKNTSDIGKYIIINSYCNYYADKKVYLSLCHNNEIIYSSIPEGIVAPSIEYSSTQRVDGNRYYIITESITETYTLTYAKDVTHLDDEFRKLSSVFIISSLFASVLLSIILFHVQRKISAPLEKLTLITADIARGNYTTRVEHIGNDEISILGQNINTMAQKVEEQLTTLEKSTKLKQMMLDNLAHEMRTPLTSIRGYADYISNANIDEKERKQASDYIISEALRLELLSEKLLDEAFIRENNINVQNTNLKELINNQKKVFKTKFIEKEIRFITPNTDTIVLCDPILVSILITNIIDNAIKACRKYGEIKIDFEETPKHVIISITDNGIGISDDQIEHLTEPFYRTDNSRSRSEGGTGLGLSLCDKITKAHNAELIIKSKIDVGTKVSIKFTRT